MAASAGGSVPAASAAGACFYSSIPWPPESLLTNTDQIIDECENVQVSGAVTEESFDMVVVVVVHMAALLAQQNLIEARHLWRRSRDIPALRNILTPWWQVAVHMLQSNVPAALKSLEQLSNMPPPPPAATNRSLNYALYAQEIAQAYRFNLIRGWIQTDQTKMSPPSFLATALGFSGPDELEQFCQTAAAVNAWQQQPNASTSGTSFASVENWTQVAAFLESRLDI